MIVTMVTDVTAKTTTMRTTNLLPHSMEVISVHGLQADELPGFYNSTCGPFTPSPTCFTQLNLKCLNGRCVCVENYVPNGSGGCNEDLVTMLVTWIVRLFVSACIFLICLTIFHLFISRKCCRQRGREEQEETADSEDRRSSTCWYDEPPPYPEAVDELPPPTYQEAVAKENEFGCSEGPTRPRERETPATPSPSPAPAPAHAPVHAPVRRGVETISTSSMPHPQPDLCTTHAHQTLHI
ncbi:hypothetical protein O3P69_017256 [Scylla paramamosain]|uniref:EB domain-containing protein n=1 Tax=Scylla paramamosain TaxID=85552 RepID=A0AAW0TYB2_SCYPA